MESLCKYSRSSTDMSFTLFIYAGPFKSLRAGTDASSFFLPIIHFMYRANEEFESMRKSNEQEMTKMAALLKKAEMKIMSLQDSFDRKTRENQELTQLCDDLINKVGTSH